jgi:hypothetical protein
MRIILLLSLFTVLFSCQHAVEKPKDLLSREEMAAILADMYLYKQSLNNIPMSKNDAFDIYVSIFKKYNTTKEIFQDSFNYYYVDFNNMPDLYDDVIDNLEDNLTKEQLKELKEQEKASTLENNPQ